METLITPPPVPIGKIKTFGPFGPKYEVGQPLRRLDDGDWMVEVTMVETGEKATNESKGHPLCLTSSPPRPRGIQTARAVFVAKQAA